MDESLVFCLLLFIAPFALCCLLEYGAGRIKGHALRRGLSLPLPLLTGGVFLLSLYKTAAVTGWDRLGWEILDYLAGSALAGTGLGWLMAKSKKQRKDL